MSRPININKKGFTLVETLIALMILSVSLTPAMMLAVMSMNTAKSINNNIIAANLAQEGIEVIRSMRDENWFAGRIFSDGFNACLAGCRVQYDSVTLMPLSGNPPMQYDSTTGFYGYASGAVTDFSRRLNTRIVGSEIIVSSQVSWVEKGRTRRVTIEDHLFDWK